MLPFLDKNKTKQAGLIIETRATPEEKPKAPHEDEALLACADHLVRAIASKDAKAVAAALHAAFTVMESLEDETEQPSPHTYEAQKETP